MRILIVSDAWHPQLNGVVRTYEHISAHLQKEGHEIIVLGPQDFPCKIPAPGYKEIKLCLFPYRTIHKKIEELTPDAVHIATEGPLGWAARRYCLRHNISFTTSYHSQFPAYFALRLSKYLPFSYPYVEKLGIAIVRTFHNKAAKVFVTTKSMRETLEKWDFKKPMPEMTRGVDYDIFYPGEKTLFKDCSGPVALYVGRVAVEKNLEAFLSMPWNGLKVVVGRGPAEESLRKKYPDIIFAGKKTGADLADHYRSADLFVFPSKTDTFGIVLIEALACGLPIAAYPVTGPKDIIEDKIFLGTLNPDLSKAAVEALKNGTSEDRAAYVRRYYSWERASRQFLEICQDVARNE